MATQNALARGGKHAVVLPLPDGSFVDVLLTPTGVLTPEMQVENPEIQTFKGASADGLYSVRFTLSPHGAFARIHTPEDGLVYIQPLINSAPEWSVVYYARDAEEPAGGIRCGVSSVEGEEDNPSNKTTAFSYGDANLRTYVMAVAANGEYTAWAGGQAPALTQITATVNNLNAIFERDLGATFTVTSPASVRFVDTSADPYGTTLDAPLLLTNHSTLNDAVGASNYGFGHLFSQLSWGGLAYQGVCNATYKGGAASGTANPTGAGWETLVAHEVGHQFGASHSFSASNGSCGSNISPTNGWEPGGGSTIMAYSSSCTGNSYQNGSDAYFHAGNLSQMSTYATGPGNSCAAASTPSNAAPVLAIAPVSYTIPHSTAFRLSGTGTDANNTALTYTHEQLDAVGGTGTNSPPSPTATTGPLFRSYPPSASSTRYFPNLATQFAGTVTPYEVLPAVARTMNFRATLRDNNPSFGRLVGEDVVVTTAGCGPFEITSQSMGTSLTANGTNQMTVTWNTASACATCPNVTLKYTSDGGATFTTLAASTPNNGSATFTVPNLPSCEGRLMLECASSIFFDVNAGAISIASTCASNGAMFSPASALSVPTAGDAALNQSLSAQYGTSYSSPLTGALNTADAASTLSAYNTGTSACISYSNATRYEVYPIRSTVNGPYTFTVSGNTGNEYVSLYSSYDPANPCANLLMSSFTQNGPGSSLIYTLCSSKSYVLVAGTPFAPATFSIAFSGGGLSSGTPNPGGGFSYSYVIVNSTTGNIVSIQSDGNMMNPVTFPTGQYMVYGLSSNASAGTMNAYVGGSFDAFRTAVLNQTGALCASLSGNTRSVTIGSVPLDAADIRLEASLTARRAARVAWTVSKESDNLLAYQIERSYDGRQFDVAATQPAKDLQQYQFTEEGLSEEATGVHYRLAARKLGGDIQYTSSIYLPFEAAVASPSLVVAPNPIEAGVLRAQIGTTLEGAYTATILDATGRVVYNARLNLARGMQSVEVPVKELSTGVYLLRVDGASAPLQVRFVKSK